MEVTPLGIVTDSMTLSENAYSPMSVRLLGKKTSDRMLYSNAPMPIDSTPSGIEITSK